MGTKKMGRPTDDPKNEWIRIRATKNDKEKLHYCCEILNKTQYEIIMEGVNHIYESVKK